MHFCGNPFHDVPMFLSAIVAESPMLAQLLVWLRGKLTRRRACTHESCDHA